MTMMQAIAPAAVSALPLGRVTGVGAAGAQAMLDASALALVRDAAVPPGSVGSYLKLAVGPRWAVAQVRALRMAEAEGDAVLAELDFVGEGEVRGGLLASFRRGVTRLPLPGDALLPVADAELGAMFAADERPHITVGTVHPSTDIAAALYIEPLLSRHFAVLGSTGCGKSSAVALLLHRICDQAPDGHVLMIDPHGEYGAAFKQTGAVFDVTNLALPYWLLNLDEHAEIFVTAAGPEAQIDREILAKCLLAARAKNRAAEGLPRLTPDAPVPYLLSDLLALLNAEMGKLDKGGVGAAPYLRLKARVEEVRADPRFAFMFSGMLVGDSMADTLARLFRLGADGQPIAIVDLSGVPSEITSVVVALLARLVFDHALWSRGQDSRPVLLVCEEAHRYVPQTGRSPARAVLERIAKEGRKYGVALGLITQRPSDLAEGVLSQCGTILSMRLNNDRDQQFVRAAVPEGAGGLIDAIPALRNREAVVVGEGVAVPIRLGFDTLEEARRPASGDPSFAGSWSRPVADHRSRLDRTVRRWRAQGR